MFLSAFHLTVNQNVSGQDYRDFRPLKHIQEQHNVPFPSHGAGVSEPKLFLLLLDCCTIKKQTFFLGLFFFWFSLMPVSPTNIVFALIFII